MQKPLLDWQRASSRTRVPGRVLERELREEFGKRYSAHELSVLTYFSGPVDVVTLKDRFTWRDGGQQSGMHTLIATPRIDTDRLFFRELRVSLDDVSQLPIAVEFQPHEGKPSPALPVLFAFRTDVDVPTGVLLAHARESHEMRTVPLNTRMPVRVASGETIEPAPIRPAGWEALADPSGAGSGVPAVIDVYARPLQQPARAAKPQHRHSH